MNRKGPLPTTTMVTWHIAYHPAHCSPWKIVTPKSQVTMTMELPATCSQHHLKSCLIQVILTTAAPIKQELQMAICSIIWNTVVTACLLVTQKSLSGNSHPILLQIALQPCGSELCTTAGLIQHHKMMTYKSSHPALPQRRIQSLCRKKKC